MFFRRLLLATAPALAIVMALGASNAHAKKCPAFLLVQINGKYYYNMQECTNAMPCTCTALDDIVAYDNVCQTGCLSPCCDPGPVTLPTAAPANPSIRVLNANVKVGPAKLVEATVGGATKRFVAYEITFDRLYVSSTGQKTIKQLKKWVGQQSADMTGQAVSGTLQGGKLKNVAGLPVNVEIPVLETEATNENPPGM